MEMKADSVFLQYIFIIYSWQHIMAMGNLIKSKETTQTATTALKVAP